MYDCPDRKAGIENESAQFVDTMAPNTKDSSWHDHKEYISS